jgi:hypothetical protein
LVAVIAPKRNSGAAFLGLTGELFQPFVGVPWVGWIVKYLTFWNVFLGAIGLAALGSAWVYV